MFGGRKTYRKGRKVRRGGFAENRGNPFGGRKTCRRKIRRGGFELIRRGGLRGQCGVNDPYCNIVD